MDASHALDLSFGREALVETFGAKLTGQIGPGFYDVGENLGGTVVVPCLNNCAVANEVSVHAKKRFKRYIPRKHELFIVTPNSVHDVPHGLQVISKHRIERSARMPNRSSKKRRFRCTTL